MRMLLTTTALALALSLGSAAQAQQVEPDTICIGATPRKGAIVPHKGKACAKQTRTQTFRVALRADVDQVIAQLPNGMLFGLRCEVAPPGLALTWYIKADIGATAGVFVHIDGQIPKQIDETSPDPERNEANFVAFNSTIDLPSVVNTPIMSAWATDGQELRITDASSYLNTTPNATPQTAPNIQPGGCVAKGTLTASP